MARIGRVQWLVLGLLAGGFIVFGRYFILNIYAGKEYEGAYEAALFLVLPILIPLIQNVGIEMQRALNKHQFRSIIYLIIAISNVAISIPLAAKWGAVGAAMGTAISLLVGNGLIMNIFYHKVLRIDMKYFWSEIAKTWKGFVGMIIFGALFTVLWGYICSLNTYLSEHNYFYVNFENTFFYNLITGAATGFAYALFELPNSFIKRRLDIVPGKPSEDKLKRAFFIFIDQADSIFGCVLVICFVCPLPVWYYFLYVAVGAVTHIIFNMLLYFCHLRKNMF